MITILKQPFDLVPAYNEIEFQADSTNTGIADFKYWVKVTYNAVTTEFYIDKDPLTGYMYFDAQQMARKYIKDCDPYPYTQVGWIVQQGTIDLTIDIGEFHTGTTHAGTTINITCFNASLKKAERQVYLPSKYQTTSGQVVKCLNNYQSKLHALFTQDILFHFLQTGQVIDDVIVTTYNGAVFGQSFVITNSNTDKHIIFNGSPASMNAYYIANPGDVSGNSYSPLFTGTETLYTLGFRSAGATQLTYFVYLDECCNRFYNTPLYYQNRFGAYDYINLCGNHKKRDVITRTFYKGLNTPFDASYYDTGGSADVLGNYPFPIQINNKVLSLNYETKQIFESDFLNEFQRVAVEDLFTSSKIITMVGSEYKLYSNENTSFEFSTPRVDKLVNIKCQLSEGLTEIRQDE